MGIQINGSTDIISAVDGSLTVENLSINTSGVGTFGSLDISGNVSVGGTLTYEDVSNVESVGVATFRDDVNIGVGGTTAFFDVSTGNIGIGTTNPDQKLELFTASGTNLVKVSTEANSTLGIELEKTGATTQSWRIADGQTVNGKLEFYDVTDTTTRMCLDGDGRLLVGNGNINSQSTFYTGRIQVQGTNSSNSAILIKTNQNDSGSPALVLAKSRGTTVGSNTIVQEGDEIGIILFNGSDGTDIASRTAHIASAVDGVVGVNSMPGRLQFSTTAPNSATPTERLRITSGGNIGIGTTNPTSYGNSQTTLVIEDDTNPAICISDTGQTRDWWLVGLSDGLGVRYADGGGSGSASNVTNSMFFKNNGNVEISTGNLVLSTSGAGIDFSATGQHAGMSSELLDDYEEGVYAATLTCGSGSITLNTNIQNLAYTRIGRLVHVQGFLSVSSVSSPSGTLLLSVPFTIDTTLSQNAENGTTAIQVSNTGIDADRWTLNVGTSSGMYIVRTNRENPTATDAAQSFSGNESITLSFCFLAA